MGLSAPSFHQVKINEVAEQWAGSLHVGLTTLQPAELPSCPLSDLSPSLTQLRSKVTWLLAGSEVRRNGVLQRQNYGCSLDRLTVREGCRDGVRKTERKVGGWDGCMDRRREERERPAHGERGMQR